MNRYTIEEVGAFLMGSAALDGIWFGEQPPGRGKFWWRTPLREALDSLGEGHIREIQLRVAKHYGIPVGKVAGKSTEPMACLARRMAMALAVRRGFSHSETARAFGRSHGSTVKAALGRVEMDGGLPDALVE